MKKPIQILALFLFFTSSLFSQNTISGKITDGKAGIYFATVALHNHGDSTIVEAESTDENGNFNFENIKDGKYYIEASMIGFASRKSTVINLPENNDQSFSIQLSEDATILTEVEVVSRKPLLEQRADRLIVNVENNLTSLNGSVIDVMKKVPGMIVIGDKLRMAGQSNMTILINGKTTKYMDVQSLLKDMPGDNIKRVEVIHQPGAEFDAEGTGPVLNIILKKNSLYGTNGNINAGIGKGEYWRYKTGLSLSHYQGAVNVQGSIGFRRNSWWERMEISRKVLDDEYTQVSEDPSISNGFRSNLSLGWDINDRHNVGFSSRYFNSKSDYIVDNTTKVNFGDSNITDWELKTENAQNDDLSMITFNPYYTFEIDTAGQKLEFDLNFAQIKTDMTNELSTTEINGEEVFDGQRNIQIGTTDIFTSKLDYTYPFSKDLKIQVGLKYSDADLDNNLDARIQDGSIWENNVGQSNHYLFTETIFASYGKATWKKGKWNGTAGLRYEKSDSEGYSVTLDERIPRPIEKLFPSASLGREITKDLGATVAYSYRIDRPRYNDLNPFKYFLDQYTFQRGNVNLAPALTHSAKFNLAFQNQPFFNIEYKHTKDAIVEVSEQNDTLGTSNLVTVNLKSFKNFNASLFFPLDFIPGVSGYGGVIANHGKYDSEYLGDNFQRSKWDFTTFISAEFMLPGKINTELSGWYNSGGQDGIINASWLYGVDVGFSKKLLNNKARVSIGVENLLARYMFAEIKYSNMDIDINSRWDGPVVNMQFSYKFGNQHMKGSKRRSSSASDVLNRAQKN